MKFAIFSALLLLCAFALPAAHADEQVRPDWLELATQDPQSRALLEKAIGKLGLRSFDELVNYVTVCDETKISRTQSGQTEQKWQTVTEYATEADLRSGKDPKDYFQDRFEADKLKFKGYTGRMIEVTPDYVRERFWIEPSICLRAGLSMLEQYETFIHELTHLVETDQLAEEDMLSYANFDDYALKTVMAPGSEVDAFIAGTSAQLRLVHSLKDITRPFRPFFDEQGNFTGDRTEFAKVVLAPRPAGMGYGDRTYRRRYAQRLATVRDQEQKNRDRIAKLAETRLKTRNTIAYDRLMNDVRARDEQLRKFDLLLTP